jgi:Pyruvate/2-oxoacid:ferredoxin oxidoreductase delta subunit
MCEFCIRHGDGKKWYLKAEHYAEELLHDTRRARYVESFIPELTADAQRWLRVLDRANRLIPRLARLVARKTSRRLQSVHFGQVLPIEDVAAILAITGQVVRLPCVCRTVLEKKERAVCYLIAASPDRLGMRELIGRREESAPFIAGMERVSRETALAQMKALEDEGAIHTVWTFITPFIGAICNCDPSGCLAVNFTRRGLPLYFPGETKAAVDASRCAGCGACVEVCWFSALSLGRPHVSIDASRCHGCGICRGCCPEGALSLVAI